MMRMRIQVNLLFLLCWSCSATSPDPALVNFTEPELFLQSRGKRAPVGGVITAALIGTGVSLAGTTPLGILGALKSDYSVALVIEIENHTKWGLRSGQSWTRWGYVTKGPVRVSPGSKEVWQAHKTTGTVVGSAGFILYYIDGLNQALGIAWHAPWNFNHLSNTLGIGIYNTEDPDWSDLTFQQLYDGLRNGYEGSTEYIGDPNWPGCKELYYYTKKPCTTNGPNFKVEGTMGQSHHPEVQIKIYPLRHADKAN